MHHAGYSVASGYARTTVFWIVTALKEEKSVEQKPHRPGSNIVQTFLFLSYLKQSISKNQWLHKSTL